MSRKAIIIGAGPAGLTAAYELLQRTDIIPIILEKSGDIGGISKTVNYKGNRIDIGGHRFFSKSDRVMAWWMKIMPVQSQPESQFTVTYRRGARTIKTEEPLRHDCENSDKVMLVRKRLSRIYFLRKFFDYPLQLSFDTLKKLGLGRTLAILRSYVWSIIFQRLPEKNLEDFFINRFGNKLYRLFFKDYTEKVWGMPCTKISPEWGAQRVKGISIGKAIVHAAKSLNPKKNSSDDINQKGTETSLIEKFLYPKYGPGQLWEEVARLVQEKGGQIHMHQEVQKIHYKEGGITGVTTSNNSTGQMGVWEGDYFFSTMPVQELVAGMDGPVPEKVKEVAAGLQYRDFITVGVLLKSFTEHLDLKDTWIYVQEKNVQVGRLQLFHNWSPYMVKEPGQVWLGMEYFCNCGDALWSQPDEAIKKLALEELEKMAIAEVKDVLDATVLRMEKTYPAYFGTYSEFDKVSTYLDGFENLFLVGRNGMHKYNNSDHSMLTSMVAVDNIGAGITSKANVWAVNTEQDYHEEKIANPSAIPEKEPSFAGFVFRQQQVLWIAALLVLLQFVIFKFLYPFPNFMPDSYSYLEAAVQNAEINIWPVGYSRFLRVFSAFIHTDTALVFAQYLFLVGSSLCLVFTLWYLLRPTKTIVYILIAWCLLNPVHLFISNYISADALFTGLSLLWLTQLIWVLCRPGTKYLWTHGVLLLVLLTLRYNALYYPFISLVIFLASRLQISAKVSAIGLIAFFVLVFVWHNGNKYRELTGSRQFSAFGGWQMATNALMMYSHLKGDKEVPPARFAALHKVVKKHLDSLTQLHERPDSVPAIYYLWNGHAPLKRYMTEKWGKDSTTGNFTKWASMAPLYNAYGKYLIMEHPMAYVKYFLWPNLVNYAAPPVEFLGKYNMGKDSIDELARDWFAYKSLRVKHFGQANNVPLMKWYLSAVAVINGGFLLCLAGFTFFGGFKRTSTQFRRILRTVIGLWLANMGFSILAAPIVMRYQLFLTTVCFTLSIFLVDFILKSDREHTNTI